MTPDEIHQRIKGLFWTHIIDLGHGIKSPGLWPPMNLVAAGCPDLRGKRVLDFCAADGGITFQAEKLGADYVLATDSWLWGDAPGTSKAAFDAAREILGSKVDSKYLPVMDHSPETLGGTFDLVIFTGVLYHMRHPLLALEKLFSVTGTQAIVESHVDMLDDKRPSMAFYPGDELNGDPSNWWGPNIPCLEAMLKTVGFSRVKLISQTPYAGMDRKLGVFNWGQKKIDWSGKRQGRALLHAWR
jgi:tRNA (mo5U34)-methyltransferase